MRYISLILTFAFFAASCIFGIKPAAAATMLLDPVYAQLKEGSEFKVKVYLIPEGDKIDTVRLNMAFTPEILELNGASKNTEFSFESSGNVMDNAKGVFSYGAGYPSGTAADTLFLSANFLAKKTGKAEIVIDPSSLTLSEGENKFHATSTAVEVEVVPAIVKLASEESIFPDGTLIRGSNGRIYLIMAGQRKHIRSLEELSKYSGRPIHNVDDSVIESYPEYVETSGRSALVKYYYGDGNLLRNAENKKIYLVGGGERMYLASPDELRKYTGVPIYNVSEAVLNEYPLTEKVKLSTKPYSGNILLRNKSNQKIYYIDRGWKVYVASLSELRKYTGKQIVNVDANVLQSYPIQL